MIMSHTVAVYNNITDINNMRSSYIRNSNFTQRPHIQPGGGNDPPEIYLGVKHGILTPDFFGKKYFLVHRSVDSQQIIKIVATSCQILKLNAPNAPLSWF